MVRVCQREPGDPMGRGFRISSTDVPFPQLR